ncbi:MAG: ABC transporter substrate-binding protein, partial [Gammaproteobacteria bacterium]|nr:ABC transporter substrate-binding protein [Gammaproteobacteria bacterium]
PGPNIQCTINLEAWNSLPEDLKQIVSVCCKAGNTDMQAEYNWGNAMALDRLRNDPNVELRELPREVFDVLRHHAQEAIDELSARDAWSRRLQKSQFDFMEKSSANQKISELAYLDMRINDS